MLTICMARVSLLKNRLEMWQKTCARFYHIQCMSQCRAVKKALELIVELLQRSLESNVISYSTAISACEKTKPSQKTLVIIEEMQQKGLAALSFDASARTPAHCDHLQRAHQRMQKGRMTERALQLFELMRLQGLRPNVVTYAL